MILRIILVMPHGYKKSCNVSQLIYRGFIFLLNWKTKYDPTTIFTNSKHGILLNLLSSFTYTIIYVS